MRAMFSAFCVAGVLATVVSATPLSREKRFAFAFGGLPFNTGAFASTGVGFNPQYGMASAMSPSRMAVAGFPFNYPSMFWPMPMPMPVYPNVMTMKNWYEGENVCKEEKIMNSQLPDDTVPDEWNKGLPRVETDYNHEQESCRGNDKKYICIKKSMNKEGKAVTIATKYECCHGFVRNPNGAPGCVEMRQSGATQGDSTKLTENNPEYYMYTGGKVGSSMSSSVRRSSPGNIDKVPLQ